MCENVATVGIFEPWPTDVAFYSFYNGLAPDFCVCGVLNVFQRGGSQLYITGFEIKYDPVTSSRAEQETSCKDGEECREDGGTKGDVSSPEPCIQNRVSESAQFPLLPVGAVSDRQGLMTERPPHPPPPTPQESVGFGHP